MNWKISSILLVAVFLFTSCKRDSDKQQQRQADYFSTKCLIEAEELSGSLTDYVLIDIRKPEEFKTGHIPNALNVWRNQITDTSYAYGGMMPTRLQVESLLSEFGTLPNDTIVIYDDKGECDAARLWWVLRYYGHKNIKLLNGGLTSWNSIGGKLTTESTQVSHSSYRFTGHPDSSIYATIELVEIAQQDSQIFILDTRSDEEFTGKYQKKGAAKAGRIEGAENLDWSVAVDFEGTKKFLPAGQLKDIYRSVGIDGAIPVVVYCHSGVRSAHTLFVLTELLGYRNIKNYDGSWSEWSHKMS